MKNSIFALASFLVFVCACNKIQPADQNAGRLTGEPNATVYVDPYPHKWGLFVNRSNPSTDSATWGTNDTSLLPAYRVQEAKEVGVSYYRMPMARDRWTDATTGATYRLNKLKEYKAALDSGLQVFLNVLWKQSGDNTDPVDFPSGLVGDNTSEMYKFQQFVIEVLDSCLVKGAYPAMVVVENEENNGNYYNLSATNAVSQYEKEVGAAKTACDAKSVKCTNGGLTSVNLVYATYYNGLKGFTGNNDSVQKWRAWARTVLSPSNYYGLIDSTPPAGITKGASGQIQTNISIVDSLLKNYYTVRGLQYVNIHWYEPIRARNWNMSKNGNIYPYNPNPYGATANDKVVPDGLRRVTEFVQKITNNTATVISNETGQLAFNTCLTKSLLYTANLYLGYVVLYNGDDDDDYSFGAKAYYNTISPTSYSQRGLGQTLQTQINSSTPSLCNP